MIFSEFGKTGNTQLESPLGRVYATAKGSDIETVVTDIPSMPGYMSHAVKCCPQMPFLYGIGINDIIPFVIPCLNESMNADSETVDRAVVPSPPRRSLRSVPVTQNTGRKHGDPRIRTYRYCIPGKCSVLFRKSSNDLSFCPKNCTANRRADTKCRHRRTRQSFRAK